MFLRSIVTIYLGLTLGLSCAAHDPPRIRFDASVRDTDRAIVKNALPAWNRVTSDEYQLMIVADDYAPEDSTLVTFSSDLPEGINGKECTETSASCPLAHYVVIREGMDPEKTLLVSQHEMGHVLGMHHLKERETGIMHPWNHAKEVSPADLTLCQAAGACSIIQVRKAP